MTPRTVLVLAASVYQLDAIRTAKRIGYRVVTLDNRSENPGHALADASYSVDTTDLDSVLEVARRERIAGIVSPCTDVAVPTAAFVAEKLGIPGPPLASARVVCSKAAFRRYLGSRGFPSPAAFDVDASFQAPAEIFDRRWIIKPNRSSGSKGVVIVDSLESLRRAIDASLQFDPDGSGVLEEFVEGFDGTCEGFLVGGRVVFSLLLDRETAPAPHVATHGHRVPTRLSVEQTASVLESIQDVLSDLRIKDGPFDCDFIVRDNDVFILEISPRLGGNSITPLVRAATGVDLTEWTLRSACGEGVDVPDAIDIIPSGLALLGTDRPGRLAFDAAEVERLRAEPWVLHLDLDLVADARVEPFTDGRKRVGEALVTGETRAMVDERVEALRRRLNVRALDDHG